MNGLTAKVSNDPLRLQRKLSKVVIRCGTSIDISSCHCYGSVDLDCTWANLPSQANFSMMTL